jgi:serine/threonine-protein kinase
MSFFGELNRRNVVRMAVLYVVAGWVVLQIADVLLEPLGLPDWTFRLVLGLLLLGFPFALIFAWVFELTPEGLKRERDIGPGRSVVRQTGNKMNVAIIVLLVLAIAGLVVDRILPERSVGPERGAELERSAGPERVAAPAGEAQAATVQEPVAAEPPAAADEGSIAVLPFVNMSGDPDNEYFSDGLSEELLNTLVRMGGLKVTGRTSSFAFKGQSRDLREIGRLLNVANVLEGSVRKAGNRVRITAQLVKTSDGYHLWSETFDRELDDIFAIQQEIAGQVTQALHVALLGGAPNAPAPVSATRDAQAYEEFLRGLYIWQRNPDDREVLDRARAHFEAALGIDAAYIDGYWGMFQVWDRMNRNGHGAFTESLERMRFYAAELERLAPASDRTLSVTARNALVDYDYQRSAARLEEAVARYPASAIVQGEYAAVLTILGRHGEATAAIDRAAQLDPLSLEVMRWKSFVMHRMGDCDGTEEVMQRAMEIEPAVGRFRYYVAMCLFENTGKLDRALPLAEAEPLHFLRYTALAIFQHVLGDPQKAQQQLDAMVLESGDSAAYQYVQIYAQWGETDNALTWLETAVRIRDPGILQVANDRLFISLRGEPRFQQVPRAAGHL